MRRCLAILALTALAAAGCGGGSSSTSTTVSTTGSTTTTPPVSPGPIALTVYRLRGGILRPSVVHVPATRAVAAAALHALGIDVPVTIAGGTATVDLPSATDTQVAEIVYTLTQFASVKRVDVAGRTGLTRSDFGSYLPPILVASPATGAEVASTFHVTGTASVFEATFVVESLRDGKVVQKRTVTASEGAPGRGTFDTTLHASPGPLTVRAFAPSAADGTPQHEVDIAVVVRP